jgi:hypothetical protein
LLSRIKDDEAYHHNGSNERQEYHPGSLSDLLAGGEEAFKQKPGQQVENKLVH